MTQKAPNITDADIERIIQRDFSQIDLETVENILSNYKTDSARERDRVYASALKLSAGDIDLLKTYIDRANMDYRDIIADTQQGCSLHRCKCHIMKTCAL